MLAAVFAPAAPHTRHAPPDRDRSGKTGSAHHGQAARTRHLRGAVDYQVDPPTGTPALGTPLALAAQTARSRMPRALGRKDAEQAGHAVGLVPGEVADEQVVAGAIEGESGRAGA